MTLTPIITFVIGASLIGYIARGLSRGWVLLVSSILAIYWTQPSMPIRNLDFWLPSVTLGLAALVWASTRPSPSPISRQDWMSLVIASSLVLSISFSRYIEPICCLIPTRPPAPLQVIAPVVLCCLLVALTARFSPGKPVMIFGLISLIGVLFVVLKTNLLAQTASAGLRTLVGQDNTLATPFDIRWLGFSYVFFRLLHTLRDRSAGRLDELSLQEYLIYILFFPAYTAGPIDRIQRFVQDLRRPFQLSREASLEGGRRILFGVFKKFVLSDTLAMMALNEPLAQQVHSARWLWILLYAYSLRIYFDFSGYTDIAIGLGRLLGVQLPENFEQPYRKPNLTTFWNSWHITLAQWFRAYFFNPVTRALRTGKFPISQPAIILIGQLSTMLLIGLWHGVNWNFAIWGLWHGLGLFIHNRWSEFFRPYQIRLGQKRMIHRSFQLFGTVLTFHYVALGWVWFVLPSVSLSIQVLFGLFIL